MTDVSDKSAPQLEKGGESELGHLVVKLWEKAKKDRSTFDVMFSEIVAHLMPERASFTEKRVKGRKRGAKSFSSAATIANYELASSVHGSLTSTSLDWFMYRFKSKSVRKLKAAREWAEQVADIVMESLREADFDTVSVEHYEDYFGVGNASTILSGSEERSGQLLFLPINLADCWFMEDMDRVVRTAFVARRVSHDALRTAYPDTVSEKIRNLAESDPFGEAEVITLYRRREGVPDLPDPWTKVGQDLRPFEVIHVEADTKTVLQQTGAYEFPVIITRMGRVAGEQYGRGIGGRALADIKLLSKARELGLTAWAKTIDPPLKRKNRHVVGKVRSYPGGITDVRDMNDLQTLYDSNSFRFDVSKVNEEELRNSIERYWHIDQLRLPPVQQSKTMSATEVEVRFQTLQKILGPSLGPLVRDWAIPVLSRVFGILARDREIPQPPEEVISAASEGGNTLGIQFVSPLMRAQRSGDVESVRGWVDDMMVVGQVDSTVFDGVNVDELREFLREARGVPARLARDQKEVSKIRKQRQEAMAQNVALQQEGAAAEIEKMRRG